MNTNETTDSQLKNELNQTMDYSQVTQQVSQYASFTCSQKEIQDSIPNLSFEEIQLHLSLVQEAHEMEREGKLVDFDGVSDTTPYTTRAKKQMVLNGKELNEIALLLSAARRIQSQLSETKIIKEFSDTLNPLNRLTQSITKQIDATGEVRENASPLMKQYHRQLSDVRTQLSERSRMFIKNNKSYLMDSITTQIDGRISVLVKAQDKNHFGGMIHGQSQSGLAFYVEPAQFVPLNNQIQTILLQIEEEKHRICTELTQAVKKDAIHIESNLETLTLLDVVFAKAKWAYHKDGCIPKLYKNDHSLYFEHARHPLLDEKTVVANTYELKTSNRV